MDSLTDKGTDLDDAISKLEPFWKKHIHVINQVYILKILDVV
jgi:hypothetical protein